MNRTIELLSIDGFQIEYSIYGQGEPVLNLHGGHSNCHEEFGYQELAANGFSVITPSRPGYGRTSKELGSSLALATEYYGKLLDHLQLPKVHVIAVSAGGPSGIMFAAKHPDRVRTLTLQSAVTKKWLLPKDTEYKMGKIMFHPKMEKYTWAMVRSMSNLFPRFIFKQMFPSFSQLTYAQARDKIAETDVEQFRKMNNRYRSYHGFIIDIDQVNTLTIEDLQAVSCPTTIMHTNIDKSVQVEHAYHAQQNIPNSELCLLDNAWGHLIWLGKSAKETDDHVMKFLKRNN